MSTEAQAYQKKESKPRDPVYIIIIILLLVGMGIMYTKISDGISELEKCSADADAINKELTMAQEMLGSDAEHFHENLEGMLAEFDGAIAMNDELGEKNQALNDSLVAKRQQVAKLLEDAKKNKYLGRSLYKAKKEAEVLRRVMKGYVHQIDSLVRHTRGLEQELHTTRTDLSDAHTKIDDYQTETTNLKDQVKKGQGVKAAGLSVTSFKLRSGVEKETDKARRAEQSKLEFTLIGNPIAVKGDRKVYMRIVGPSGTLLTNEKSGSFEFDGSKGQYSKSRTIDYQGHDIEVELYFAYREEVEKGTYTVFLYTGGIQIGKTTYDLK